MYTLTQEKSDHNVHSDLKAEHNICAVSPGTPEYLYLPLFVS